MSYSLSKLVTVNYYREFVTMLFEVVIFYLSVYASAALTATLTTYRHWGPIALLNAGVTECWRYPIYTENCFISPK